MTYTKPLLSTSLSFLFLLCFSQVFAQTYNYCDVLHKSLLFYEAQRAGRLPTTNRVPWRNNSNLADCTSILCVLSTLTGDGNLAGGYYDAGDGVKFMFPQAFTTTTLSWGLIQFKSAVDACGETQNYLNTIRWATDFIMECHTSPLTFWGQIGNGGIDHSYWEPPELYTMPRPTYEISSTAPGTELALEAASALAAASIVFKTVDPVYSALLLTHARQLYTLGYNYRGFYSDSIPDAANYYKSYGYTDELVWGSSWMYRATGENSFLIAATSDYVTNNIKFMSPGQSYDWDQKCAGVIVNMWQITGDTQYLNDAQAWLNSWYQGGGKTYTPGGLVWQSDWGTLRYAAGSAFLALLVGDSRANTWAKSQIDYMLGTNNQQRSFVCGFGNNSPINPHHRAAHGSTTNDINNPVNNLHILTGALVGGPDKYDNYADVRTDYVKNEVAIDYNAAFTGALAGLAGLLGISQTTTPAPITTPLPTTTTTTTTTQRPSTTPTPTTTTPTTSKPSTITPTTTAAPLPPISQATTRPSTPTSSTSSSSSSTSSSSSGKISIQLNSGSNVWWLGVAVLNGAATTSTVEFTDAGSYPTFTPLLATNWGYFIFSPTGQLTLPINLRLTSSTGTVLVLTNAISSLTQFAPMLTNQQYGASSRSLDVHDEAHKRAIANTPVNAHTTKLRVHQGSSVWWLAVALFDAREATASVEVKDAVGLDFTLRDGKWGFWLLETQGTALSLPLTVTTTSTSGASLSFIVTEFSHNGVVIDSETHY